MQLILLISIAFKFTRNQCSLLIRCYMALTEASVRSKASVMRAKSKVRMMMSISPRKVRVVARRSPPLTTWPKTMDTRTWHRVQWWSHSVSILRQTSLNFHAWTAQVILLDTYSTKAVWPGWHRTFQTPHSVCSCTCRRREKTPPKVEVSRRRTI